MQRQSLGFLLTDCARLIRRAFQRRIEGSPLTLAQARTLVYLARLDGPRQVELAEVLEVKPITLARLVDQLEESGLVERRPDPADRRAYRLYLTQAAEPLLAEIEETIAAIRAEMLKGLSAQEAAAVLSALGKIRDNLAADQRP